MKKKTDSTKPKAALSYFKNHCENSGIRDRTCKDVNSLLVRVSYSEFAMTINALISLHWPLFACYYFTLIEDIIGVNFLPHNDYFLTIGDVAFLAYMVHINLLPKFFFCATEVMVLATLCSRFFFCLFVCFFPSRNWHEVIPPLTKWNLVLFPEYSTWPFHWKWKGLIRDDVFLARI